MAKPQPRPGPATRTKGAEAIAYRFAMVVTAMDELFTSRSPGRELPTHARNAFIQSALIDLRALIGFLLMDAVDVVPTKGGTKRSRDSLRM
jgi:hypothetical protein